MLKRKNITAYPLLIALVLGTLAIQGCGPGQEKLRIGALEHFRRGNQLFNSNDPRGAVSEYQMAIAMDDGEAVFYFNMGLAYYQLVLYNQSIDAYRAAITLDQNFGEAWFNLSLALDKIGETDKAFLAYERYQAINGQKLKAEPKPDKPIILKKPDLQNRDGRR